MAQVAECLPTKHCALSSKPSTAKTTAITKKNCGFTETHQSSILYLLILAGYCGTYPKSHYSEG
jgi:hypothetical protein